MGIATEKFQQGDVCLYYDYEDVMFRFDFASKKFFRKFIGQDETEVPFNNDLLNQARLFGCEIDRDTYDKGKP